MHGLKRRGLETEHQPPRQSPTLLRGDSYLVQYDGPVAAKPYVLIAGALARNTKVAVAKLA